MSIIVEVDPTEIDRIPWQEHCLACAYFHEHPEPGLLTWCEAVSSHFERKHDVELVAPEDGAR